MAIGTLAAIGLAAAGVGSAMSASSQKKAANKAADTSMAVAQENNALARDIYGQNKETLAPYVNTGVPATGAINSLLGMSGDPNAYSQAFDNYRNSTGYQFRQNEGMRGLDAKFAGLGAFKSGAAVRGAADYNQNLASGEFGNFLNALGNQQALGLSAASAQAGVGQNFVNTISNNNNSAGTAAANAALLKGQNNGLANGLSLIGGGLFGMGSF